MKTTNIEDTKARDLTTGGLINKIVLAIWTSMVKEFDQKVSDLSQLYKIDSDNQW